MTVGQFGTSQIVAQFQGVFTSALVKLIEDNCAVVAGSTGQIIISLGGPNNSVAGASTNDACNIVQVQQFGQAVQRVDIAYGTPAENDILLTFGGVVTPAFPTASQLFNVIVTQGAAALDANGNFVPPYNP